MSVSAVDEREEKLKWLVRPINWASHVAMFALLVFAMPVLFEPGFLERNVSMIAYGAITAIAVIFALLFWGMIRVMRVARGQY